ncbi:HAD family hydrolase [Myxosarcina sp. GI1(2024)]
MLEAILFDLDGTLANTDPIHFAVWQDILTRYELEIDRSFYRQRISGRTNAEIIQDILPQISLEEAWHLAIEKEENYRQLTGSLRQMPGLARVLQLTDTVPLKKAVVTNAPKENTEHMLRILQLTHIFPVVIMAEDAPPGKPHPAPYNLALERLGVTKERAMVFEDSPAGIRSAVGAGIYTIGIASTHTRENLIKLGADMAIDDFNSEELWQLLDKKVFC